MVALNIFALATILPAMVMAHSVGQQAHGSVNRRHHAKVKAARAVAGDRNTTPALKKKRSTNRKRKCRPRPTTEAAFAEGRAQQWSEQPADDSAVTWEAGASGENSGEWQNDAEWQNDGESQNGGEWQGDDSGSADVAGNAADYGNEFHSEAWADDNAGSSDEANASDGAVQQPAGGDGNFRIGRTLSGPCGTITTNDAAPNGEQWWLTCGVSTDDWSSAWNPPHMGLEDIVYQDFEHGDWAGCEAFAWAFNDPNCNLGINPAILAAIARQESSCNPNIRGKNGEYGLMQVMPFNCIDESVCMDVWHNIRNGANVFKTYLEQSGGNVLLALGKYNGWKERLTYYEATQPAREGRCWAQANLDYLHQMLNGFVVGRNAYTRDFPTMFSEWHSHQITLSADAPRRELRLRVNVGLAMTSPRKHMLVSIISLLLRISMSSSYSLHLSSTIFPSPVQQRAEHSVPILFYLLVMHERLHASKS